jgi:hypothetical protein
VRTLVVDATRAAFALAVERASLLRAATFALAFVHLFPAKKHLAIFVAAPSLDEAWKGFGGLLAVVLYFAPPRAQARVLAEAWRRARPLLVALGWLLALVHLAPALDHVPRFVAAPSWADAWRGFGACVAAAWFALPLEHQARLLSLLTLLQDASSRFTRDAVRKDRPARAPRGAYRRAV